MPAVFEFTDDGFGRVRENHAPADAADLADVAALCPELAIALLTDDG